MAAEHIIKPVPLKEPEGLALAEGHTSLLPATLGMESPGFFESLSEQSRGCGESPSSSQLLSTDLVIHMRVPFIPLFSNIGNIPIRAFFSLVRSADIYEDINWHLC